MDEEIEREKQDRIFPTSSHRFPDFPILPAISRYFLSTALRWNKIFQIRSHSVPFLLFLAFGQAMPLRLSADTSRGGVRPAQASSTIDRTHDHMLSKSKGPGKRQMLSGFPNAIALGLTPFVAIAAWIRGFGGRGGAGSPRGFGLILVMLGLY